MGFKQHSDMTGAQSTPVILGSIQEARHKTVEFHAVEFHRVEFHRVEFHSRHNRGIPPCGIPRGGNSTDTKPY